MQSNAATAGHGQEIIDDLNARLNNLELILCQRTDDEMVGCADSAVHKVATTCISALRTKLAERWNRNLNNDVIQLLHSTAPAARIDHAEFDRVLGVASAWLARKTGKTIATLDPVLLGELEASLRKLRAALPPDNWDTSGDAILLEFRSCISSSLLTEAAVERCFATLARLLTSLRNRLSDERVNDIMLLAVNGLLDRVRLSAPPRSLPSEGHGRVMTEECWDSLTEQLRTAQPGYSKPIGRMTAAQLAGQLSRIWRRNGFVQCSIACGTWQRASIVRVTEGRHGCPTHGTVTFDLRADVPLEQKEQVTFPIIDTYGTKWIAEKDATPPTLPSTPSWQPWHSAVRHDKRRRAENDDRELL